MRIHSRRQDRLYGAGDFLGVARAKIEHIAGAGESSTRVESHRRNLVLSQDRQGRPRVRRGRAAKHEKDALFQQLVDRLDGFLRAIKIVEWYKLNGPALIITLQNWVVA